MATRGRPSKIDKLTQNKKAIDKMLQLGATMVDIAEFLEVDEATIYNWQNKYPKYFESLKDWKDIADGIVEQTLYQKAKGGIVVDERIVNPDGSETIKYKRIPPDTTAQIFWLKNRQSKRWRDRQDIDLSGSPPIEIRLIDAKD